MQISFIGQFIYKKANINEFIEKSIINVQNKIIQD